MAKVFITGAAGFLGSHLADEVLKRGHEVVAVDNLLGGYEDNVPNGAKFYKADARDFKKMALLMQGAQVVYHCAAAPHEGLSVFAPNVITEHTYNSTVAIASAAAISGVKRMVFCSSMSRYGQQDRLPFTEDMEPRPKNPYGVAKYAAELCLKSLCQAHGLEYVVAVPHNIIGPRQKYDDPYRNVAAIMINLMLQGRQPIIYGDGEQKRCFSFVADVIDPLMKMGFEPQVLGQIINVGPDEEFVTINELCVRIAKLMDFKSLKPVYVSARPLEVKLATCSADKCRMLLGYRTSTSLDQGLMEMIKWIEQRGPRPFKYHLDLEIINHTTPVTWKDRLF